MDKPDFYKLCRILADRLVNDDDFFAWFADRIGLEGGPFVNRISDLTPWTGGGPSERPSDVLVIAEDAGTGQRWGIHVRNLVRTARLYPEQAKDYPKRARTLAPKKGYSEWKTVLVAHDLYDAELRIQAFHFDAVVTHEQLGDFVPEYRDAL